MRDFDKQLERYGDELKNAHCPYSDAELDREIRSVVWNEKVIPNKPQTKHLRTRWLWPTVAAVACLLAILIPLNMPVPDNNSIASVDVDGEHLYFACNNGCTPESTLENFKSMLR